MIFYNFSWYPTRYKNFENSMWSDLEVWKRHAINFIKMDEKYWKFGFSTKKCDFSLIFSWFDEVQNQLKNVISHLEPINDLWNDV